MRINILNKVVSTRKSPKSEPSAHVEAVKVSHTSRHETKVLHPTGPHGQGGAAGVTDLNRDIMFCSCDFPPGKYPIPHHFYRH